MIRRAREAVSDYMQFGTLIFIALILAAILISGDYQKGDRGRR